MPDSIGTGNTHAPNTGTSWTTSSCAKDTSEMCYAPESCLLQTATRRPQAGSDQSLTQCQACSKEKSGTGEEADTNRLLVRKIEFEEKLQARQEKEGLPVWEADLEHF